MDRRIIITDDGSQTIEVPELGITYHSRRGALIESETVFIRSGLHYIRRSLSSENGTLNIFEMGFGTGLNAFLTAKEVKGSSVNIHYTAVETTPLSTSEASLLSYASAGEEQTLFNSLHSAPWGKEHFITPNFTLLKLHQELLSLKTEKQFNLVYYDAFAPSAQPELWTAATFQFVFEMMAPQSTLVTYCSKGDVRRAMQKAGFLVEKLPGPPGKREIVRATKN